MGPTRAGVPVTSCAERIPLRDPPQGKSRADNTLACCPAAGSFSRVSPLLVHLDVFVYRWSRFDSGSSVSTSAI
ncbi:hypothetical protein EVAR_98709_1 [Eumeta japonica]|uniref:Uncharacterized protein n=1 Tax=Eumeta variegata TaxID=151549 RepID=A0A4C1XY92_EUMVA|nr:hypothetical protein EVAR_98709_1 [Eumeta japonica]